MYNAPSNETIPRQMTLDVFAVSRSWQEGIGLDMEEYTDLDIANWLTASSGVAWTSPGGDFHSSPKYDSYFENGDEDVEINVSNIVEQWIAGTKSKFGFFDFL